MPNLFDVKNLPAGVPLKPSLFNTLPVAAKKAVAPVAKPQTAAAKAVAAPAKVALPPLTTGGPTTPAAAPTDQAKQSVDHLGNLRLSLRAALNEAAQRTASQRMTQLSGFVGGGAAPSVIKAAIGLAQSGLQTSQETVFGDIMASYKDATEARQKEIDRINNLRLEYGSAIPGNVTDLQTAIALVIPLVDEERKAKLTKLTSDQAVDDDIQTWAESYARGEVTLTSVPSKIRSAVLVAANKITSTLETQAKEEYKNRITFRLEQKTSNYDSERTLTIQDDNLNVAEQREILNYIDGLEAAEKAAKTKKSSGSSGNIFNFLPGSKKTTII